MKQLTNVEEKEKIAEKVKELVKLLNEQIFMALPLGVSIRVYQRTSFSNNIPKVTVYISEDIKY